jgi:hypothetical protein
VGDTYPEAFIDISKEFKSGVSIIEKKFRHERKILMFP